MRVESVSLSVKPAGSTTWVHIDPTSPTGQAFARRLGFTTSSTKEDTMSAVPIETMTQERHLRVVENNKEQMGLLLQARRIPARVASYLARLGRRGLDWARRTFHLDPVLGVAADGIRWVKAKTAAATGFLGVSGGAGVGLLAVSTSFGRSVLSVLMRPVGWVARLLHGGYIRLEELIHSGVDDDEATGFAKARNAVSHKMADAREFVYKGIIKATQFFVKRVSPVFAMNSVPMHAARTAGTVLAGRRAIAALALLPLGGFAMAARYIAMAGLGAIAIAQNLGFIARVRTWLEERFGKATKIAKGEDDKGSDVVDIMTAAAETASVTTHGTTGGNRASRRAQQRAAAKTGSKS